MCTSDKVLNRLSLFTFFALVIILPLGIASMVISNNSGEQWKCNYKHPMGMDLKGYLFGSGFSEMMFAFAVGLADVLYKNNKRISLIFFVTIATIKMIFGLIWAAIGGTILHDANWECIENGYPLAIYTLVQWCFAIVVIMLCLIGILTFPKYEPEKKNPIALDS